VAISPVTFQVMVSTTATLPASGIETNSRPPSGDRAQSSPGLFRKTMVSSLLLP